MNISDIHIDHSVQSRTAINPKTVEHYRQIIESEEDLEPVVIFHDGQTNWLSDGFHRIEAYKKADRTEIPTDIRQGTRRDAILFAIEANAKHGLCLSLAERKNAATTLLQDTEWSQWSDRKIARLCGIEHHTVKKIRTGLESEDSSEKPNSKLLRSVSGDFTQIRNFTNDSDLTEASETLRSVSGDFTQIRNFTSPDERSRNTRKADRGGKSYTINTTNIGQNPQEKFVDTGLQARSNFALPPSTVEILNLDPLTINASSLPVDEPTTAFRIISIDCPDPTKTSDDVVAFNVKVETLGPQDAWPTILSQMQAHPEFASMVWKEAQKLEFADQAKMDPLLVG